MEVAECPPQSSLVTYAALCLRFSGCWPRPSPLRCSRRRHRPSGTAPPTTAPRCRTRRRRCAGSASYLDGRDGVVQVALWDQRAGRLYRLSNGDDTQYTASIVKVDILARWLRTYDKQGASIPDDIPYSIKYLMQRMIQNSDNAAATSLFYFGGGCDSLTKFNRLIPMDDTDGRLPDPELLRLGQHHDHGRRSGPAHEGVRLRPPEGRPVLRRPGLRQPAHAGRRAGPAVRDHLRPLGQRLRPAELRAAGPGRHRVG